MRVARILVAVIATVAIFGETASAAVLSEKIVFASNRDGDFHIYSMDPDGSNVVQLTNDPLGDVQPAISPDGTRIAFLRWNPSVGDSDLWVMNADGTGQTKVTRVALNPTWSPDGTKIAFGAEGHGNRDGCVYAVNADGTNEHIVTCVDRDDLGTSWSPDGTAIAFAVDLFIIGPPGDGNGIYTVKPDGTGLFHVVPDPPGCEGCVVDGNTDWRPDGALIAFDRDRTTIMTVKPDGTAFQAVAPGSDPSWSPDATRFALVRGSFPNEEIYRMNSDGSGATPLTSNSARDIDPDWGQLSKLIGPGYPRPKGASPMHISLVPAQKQCAAPNTTHGAPLAFGSCGPPQLASGQLTTGTPDSNGLPVRMDASLRLQAIPGNSATPANEADVQIAAHLSNVFNKDLSDYTGALRATLPLRITDHDNTPSVGGPGAATTAPFQYGFDVPCTPDPAPTLGSDCSLLTTADALVPGTVKESLRTIWQVGRVRVDDAGPDGNPDTTADNTVFAVQGVFVP